MNYLKCSKFVLFISIALMLIFAWLYQGQADANFTIPTSASPEKLITDYAQNMERYMLDSALFQWRWLENTRPTTTEAFWDDIWSLWYTIDPKDVYKSPKLTKSDGGDCEDLAGYSIFRLSQVNAGVKYGLMFLMTDEKCGHVVAIYLDKNFRRVVLDASMSAGINSGIAKKETLGRNNPLWYFGDYVRWVRADDKKVWKWYKIWWFDTSDKYQMPVTALEVLDDK